MSAEKYPTSQSFLMSSFLTEEAIHLPPAPDPDMIGVLFWEEEMGAWALELEGARVDK